MKKLLALLCLVSLSANSSCYIVDNLEGYASNNFTDYEIEERLSNKLYIEIDGNDSTVSGRYEDCSQVDNGINVIKCDYESDRLVSYNTYVIDEMRKKAFITGSMFGSKGIADGIKMFVGDVVGRCD